ncbi:hypothetical protein D3C81_1765050 [compost metagenome]
MAGRGVSFDLVAEQCAADQTGCGSNCATAAFTDLVTQDAADYTTGQRTAAAAFIADLHGLDRIDDTVAGVITLAVALVMCRVLLLRVAGSWIALRRVSRLRISRILTHVIVWVIGGTAGQYGNGEKSDDDSCFICFHDDSEGNPVLKDNISR